MRRRDKFRGDLRRKGLGFVRTTGEEEMFAFAKCARGREITRIAMFANACRRSVCGSIAKFRRGQFGRSSTVPCAISGALVTEADCHVDHADPPFRDIVKDFCAEHEWEAMELADGFGKTFAKPGDAKRFRDFHDVRAVLQVVPAKANLAKRYPPTRSPLDAPPP